MAWLAVALVLTCFVELWVSAIYLRVRETRAPQSATIRVVASYPGLGKYIARYAFRYIGLGLRIILCCFAALLVCAVVFDIVSGVMGTGGGKFAVPGIGRSTWLVTQLAILVYAAMWAKFQLAIPMFAIQRGTTAPEWLLDQSVIRAGAAFGIMLAMSITATLPIVFVYAGRRLFKGVLVPSHGSGTALEYGWIVLEYVWYAWFVLLRTSVALHLLEQMPIVLPAPPPPMKSWLEPQSVE